MTSCQYFQLQANQVNNKYYLKKGVFPQAMAQPVGLLTICHGLQFFEGFGNTDTSCQSASSGWPQRTGLMNWAHRAIERVTRWMRNCPQGPKENGFQR
jgi:hypothetical protein